MYLVFSLMSVIGAWAMWRRKPGHSTGSAFKILAIVLFLMATAVGVIVGTIQFIENRSPIVQFTVGIVVFVFLTVGMILSISAVATPKEARLHTALPTSALVSHIHRRNVTLWARHFGIFLVACATLALLLPQTGRYIIGALAGMFSLLALVMLPVGYIMARRFDRALTALELSPWVHWRYTAAQWTEWSTIQVERIRSTPPPSPGQTWRRLAATGTILMGCILAFCPGSLLERTLYGFFCIGLLVGIAELSGWEVRHRAERLRTKLRAAPPDVFFGHDGVFCNGTFNTWLEGNLSLQSAAIDGRPPRSLLLRFEKTVPNPYGPPQILPLDESVLIPEGSDADLDKLQHELCARCPAAHIDLKGENA